MAPFDRHGDGSWLPTTDEIDRDLAVLDDLEIRCVERRSEKSLLRRQVARET
jgi:hypothetical protein